MKQKAKIWQTSWRALVGMILLTWIFHSIFYQEAKSAAETAGLVWSEFAKSEQWRLAWVDGPIQLWQTITLIPLSSLILSVALMGFTIYLGVIRWRMALAVQGIHLDPKRALAISFVAHFFNSFLLGSTGGDLMKAYYAAHESHHQKAEAVVTVFVDRFIGLWSMSLFACLMLIPNTHLLFNHDKLWALSIVVLLMFVVSTVFMVIAFHGGVTKVISGARIWLRRLPKGELLERSLASSRQFGKSPWYLPKASGISMLLNTVCVLQLIVISHGLKQEISSWALFAIVPMIICVSAIPITPSGLGVRENLFVLMLAAPPLLVDSTSALSLSLLAYAGSLFWSLIGGVVYATMKRKNDFHESNSDNEPNFEGDKANAKGAHL